MKHCPSCGDEAVIHKQGMWVCVSCGFSHDHVGKRPTRAKRYLERIDRIGARLSNVRW